MTILSSRCNEYSVLLFVIDTVPVINQLFSPFRLSEQRDEFVLKCGVGNGNIISS